MFETWSVYHFLTVPIKSDKPPQHPNHHADDAIDALDPALAPDDNVSEVERAPAVSSPAVSHMDGWADADAAPTNPIPADPALAEPAPEQSAVDEPDIADLIAAGQYGQAASLARDRGQYDQAIELYERIWAFADAAAAARAGGDLARALQNAIDARDESQVRDLAAELDHAGENGQRAAMEVFRRRRRFAEAATRAEAIGELEQAIEDYRHGHRELDAARVLERLGRDREAGRLLERLVGAAGSGLERAQARLRLGLLLARRMQFAPAAEHLQEAAREPTLALAARRPLVVCLASMGLRDAAREVLTQARADHPELPADIETFLRAEREAEWTRSGADVEAANADTTGADTADADTKSGPSRAGESEPAQILGGRYRLGELVGAGGTGRVFQAFDEVGERTVAIKIFSLSRDHQAYQRFVREARITGGLRHDHLVEVYDFSAERGYLVMEYMPGGSLAQRLSAQAAAAPATEPAQSTSTSTSTSASVPRPDSAATDTDPGADPAHPETDPNSPRALPERAVRRLALDLLSGLEVAHRRGIIHRDIKPANVFFDARGNAKLGDFGVAHLLDLGQTQTGGLIGTLAYMSPEQITGAPLTIAADLYALGITLYESLTGRLPLLGPDFIAQHLGQPPPPASQVAAESAAITIDPGWDPILATLLAKSPSDRYDSIDAVRTDLQALDLGSAVKPLILRRRTAPAAAAAQATAADDLMADLLQPGPDADPEHAAGPADDPEAERYQFETAIGQTEISHLTRALDTTLDRSVVIERYREGAVSPATEQRLYALARGGSPFLQWALAYDREAGVAVFEAPSGEPIGEAVAARPLDARAAATLLMRLSRAVAPLHQRGLAHGALGPATIVVDAQLHPTIIISGLGPAPDTEPGPRADICAILRLVAESAGGALPPSPGPDRSDRSDREDPAPLAHALVDQLAPGLDPALRAAVCAHTEVDAETEWGEALYAFAEALEIALLPTGRSRASA